MPTLRSLRTDSISFVALAWLTLGLTGCSESTNDEPVAPPADVAPSFSSIDKDGRWLVLNYWAEWCKPCLEEIPELNAYAAEHADSVHVVLVNYDGVTGTALRDLGNDLGIETDMVEADPSATLGIEKPQVLPSTFVFDPELKLTHTLLGPQTRETLGNVIAH